MKNGHTMFEDDESNLWLVSFDIEGFEAIINVSEAYIDESMEALVNDDYKSKLGSTYHMMEFRARFNEQRRPQIYTFRASSDITEETLRNLANENPQFLADFVRENGKKLYGSESTRKVINL